MLDPIITSYQLTINVLVTYYRIQEYTAKYIYNKMTGLDRSCFQ